MVPMLLIDLGRARTPPVVPFWKKSSAFCQTHFVTVNH